MPHETPLYDRHVAAGAAMVEFAGYSMPQQYTSIREEHVAVRHAAGLFDISHMGEVSISGPGALATLQRLCANDVSRLTDGQALYSVMCTEAGGIVDDVIVYRDAADAYMVVVNAGCRDKDVAWMQAHLEPHTEFADVSDATALLAVQGPAARDLVAQLTGSDPTGLAPFHHAPNTVAGVPARVSRTGYTGEDGYELYVAAEGAETVWDALVEAGKPAGLTLCGLGARDTLRLEAGLRLYGQDMDETTDPISVGLGWTVKLDRQPEAVGSAPLRAIDRHNPPRRFLGLALPGRAIARHGQPVSVDGEPAGVITSGGFSFTLGHGIATASVRGDLDPAEVSVDIRGSATPAQVVPLPFYRRPRQPQGD